MGDFINPIFGSIYNMYNLFTSGIKFRVMTCRNIQYFF